MTLKQRVDDHSYAQKWLIEETSQAQKRILEDELPEAVALSLKGHLLAYSVEESRRQSEREDRLMDKIGQVMAERCEDIIANSFKRAIQDSVREVFVEELPDLLKNVPVICTGNAPGSKRRKIGTGTGTGPQPGYEDPKWRMKEDTANMVALHDEWHVSTEDQESIEERDKTGVAWRSPQESQWRKKKKLMSFLWDVLISLKMTHMEAAILIDRYCDSVELNLNTFHSRIVLKRLCTAEMANVKTFSDLIS